MEEKEINMPSCKTGNVETAKMLKNKGKHLPKVNSECIADCNEGNTIINICTDDKKPSYRSNSKLKKTAKHRIPTKLCGTKENEKNITDDVSLTEDTINKKGKLNAKVTSDQKIQKKVSFSESVPEDKEDKREQSKQRKRKNKAKYKKFKKSWKKQKLAKADGTQTNIEQEPLDRKQKAVLYLEIWKKDKTNWKFQTITQMWLLKNMFDKNRVPDETFEILTEYVITMKGSSREIAANLCQQVIHKMENKTSDSQETEDKSDLKEAYSRARSILQCL